MKIKKEHKRMSPIQRLVKHKVIDEKTGCWNWNGRINKNGYGQVTITVNNKSKSFEVHRYSYTTYNNVELTSFDTICHQCHNRRCFNPAHLIKSIPVNNSIERIRDWNEFKIENKILVDEYLQIIEKIKKTYFDWRRKV